MARHPHPSSSERARRDEDRYYEERPASRRDYGYERESRYARDTYEQPHRNYRGERDMRYSRDERYRDEQYDDRYERSGSRNERMYTERPSYPRNRDERYADDRYYQDESRFDRDRYAYANRSAEEDSRYGRTDRPRYRDEDYETRGPSRSRTRSRDEAERFAAEDDRYSRNYTREYHPRDEDGRFMREEETGRYDSGNEARESGHDYTEETTSKKNGNVHHLGAHRQDAGSKATKSGSKLATKRNNGAATRSSKSSAAKRAKKTKGDDHA